MRDRFETNGIRTRAMSIVRVLLVSLALVPAVAARPSRALAQTAESVELPPIVVDGERMEEPALVERSFETPEDVSGFGETIFAEPTWRSFETTAELLGESVGAQIRRQGGRDDFSTLSIRGAPAAQLRILLDGVALGRASDSVVNLADLPSDLVDRIEVYRGFSPVALTPVSSAGVVNVITRSPEKATSSLAIGGGSFGSVKMNAGGGRSLFGGSASAFGSYRHTDGDFDFVDPNSRNPNDDEIRRMQNNDGDAVESLLRWNRGVTDSTKLQLRNHVFRKDEGVPDIEEDVATDTRLETTREIAAASLGGTSGRWNADQIVTWERKELSRSADDIDNTADTTASTTIGRWTSPLGKANWISGSADYTWEGFDQRFETPPFGVDGHRKANRNSLAVAVGDDWTIDWLEATISMQIRHHQIWNDSNDALASEGTEHSTDPRLGLKWEPLTGIAVKANGSTYFRPPSFNELYGVDGFTVGNPSLVPETGIAWDAGLEWTAEREPFGKIAAGYSWFGSDIDDIVVVRLNFDREVRASNVSEAEVRGHELRVDWKGPRGVSISANYTHQEALDRSGFPGLDGRDLPGIAPDEGWVRVAWEHAWLVAAYELEVTGAHWLDPEQQNEDEKVPTRTVHGVSLICGPFWKGLRVTIEGRNLSDSLVPDVIGYPLPGRAFFATLSWSTPREG